MIRLVKPYISFDEVEAEFREIFESGWYSRGKHVAAFADGIRNYTGARHVFLTTSATTALWTCLRLLEIGPGDEVIVSDFSFPATANVVEDVGATPGIRGCQHGNVQPAARRAGTEDHAPNTCCHFRRCLGKPVRHPHDLEICRKHGLPLVEDAACAIGSSENGVRCGNIADLTCFSFHPRKLLTTGEGGAITTHQDVWAKRLEIKLAHGAVVENGKIDFVDYGYNFRLSELQAVMGIKQLAKLDAIVRDRNLIRDAYDQALEPLGFRGHRTTQGVVHNVQSLVFRVPWGADRDALIANLLKDRGVETTLGTYCLSGTSYYRGKYRDVQPNAMRLQETTITLPCFEGVNIQFVIDAISQLSGER